MKAIKLTLIVSIVSFLCVSMFLMGEAWAAPSIASPAPGLTLSGSTVTFT